VASIAGFVIGNALARQLDEANERERVALVGALMPTPLVGALIAAQLVDKEDRPAAMIAGGGWVAARARDP
jgi:hypothetical protein